MRVPSANERHGVAGAHDVAHEFQHGAEPPARMQFGEFHRGETAALQERDRERVAERLLHQRRGGRGEIVRAGLARLRQRHHHVGGLRQRAVRKSGHGNKPDLEAAGIVGEILQFGGLARPGQRHDHIVGRDHAEVAMARLAGMHEIGGSAGGGEGRRDLAADMAGLSHAADDQPPVRLADHFDRSDKGLSESVMDRRRQRGHPAGFGLQRPHCGCNQVVRLPADVGAQGRRFGHGPAGAAPGEGRRRIVSASAFRH